MPSHAKCNRKKSGSTFHAAPILLVHLKKAADKADEVRAEIAKGVSDRRIGNALAVLEKANEAGDLAAETLIPLIERFLAMNPDAWNALREPGSSGGGGLARFNLDYAYVPPPPSLLRLAPFAHVMLVSGRALLTDPSSPAEQRDSPTG